MESALRTFLLLLRNLVSFFRKRWGQATRRLWYIFALLRLRLTSRRPTKGHKILRSDESQLAEPNPTTVICASRLPPSITPIIGSDGPIVASPTPVTIKVHRPTILNPEDIVDEPCEGGIYRIADGHFLEESRQFSGSPDFVDHYDEPNSVPPEEFASRSPVVPSRPSSQYSYLSASKYAGHRAGSHHSNYPPSEHSRHSPINPNGAEAAARGYLTVPSLLRPSSPALSVRTASTAGSVASRVYRASRPSTRARRPSPIPWRNDRSPTPTPTHQSVNEVPPEFPELPRSRTPTSKSAHSDGLNGAIGFSPSLSPPPKGRLRPMIGIDRYEKHRKVIVEDAVNTHICPPVTTQFVRESTPENWVPLMHPEGALYWVHENNPIYTDANMCDPVLRQQIEEALEEINELKESCPPLPVDDWELALELGQDVETGEPICSYYFVCLSARCLFWLHDFDLESVLAGLRGVTELPHIHLALQAQYWTHWEMYPHDREVPEPLLQELLGILVHAGVDCMTSRNSTAAYSEGELSKLLDYAKHVTSIGGNCGFSACIVGRLMSFFLYARYLNFYGQKGARLTNDQTIYGTQPKRTCLFKIMSVLLFSAPEVHLRGLESIYTDFVLCQHRWAQFITPLQADWSEFVLYGAVLLIANVAFLALPSVDPGNHHRTPVQLTSYFSVITSIGSTVIGLLLLRQHRTKPQDAAEEVDTYLRSRYHTSLGFETLAIQYSLPYSLLLWSVLMFTTAVGLETLVFSRQMWARLSVGIVFAVVVFLILWCAWTTVAARTGFCASSSVSRLKFRLVDFARGLRGKIPVPRPSAEDGGGGGDQGNRRGPLTLREAFDFVWRTRRRTTLVSSTIADDKWAGSVGSCDPPDGTGMEIDNKDSQSVV